MKKILLFFVLIISVVLISGCPSPLKTYNNSHYSYNYPASWNITFQSNEGQDLNGTGLLKGHIYTDTLKEGQNAQEYLNETYPDWAWNSSKQVNGNTYIEGYKGTKIIDYNIGAFIKGKTIYIIQIYGYSDATNGFKQIRDSYKIN